MTLQRFLTHKITLAFSGKKFALPLILLVLPLVSCCGCFALALVDVSLREVGLLPTYTFSPTHSATVLPSQTQTSTKKPSSTPLPTTTKIPSATPALDLTKTPTMALESTETPTLVNKAMVIIKDVNKVAEYVELENIGNQPQDLMGWRIVSERGNQVCRLAGILKPGETLRVWTNNPDGEGYNCNLRNNIWNDYESDPAVLYNAQGVEVSRYP